MSKRNNYIDVLRGAAIILVVLGHVIQCTLHGDSTNSVHLVIQSFQMALLMMISGYVKGYSKIKNNYKSAIKNCVYRLLIPYIVWEQLHYFFRLLRYKESYSVKNHFGGLIWSEFWFLRVLFILCIFYIMYVYIINIAAISGIRHFLIILMIFVLIFLFSLIKGLADLRLYSLYFALGVVLFNLRENSEDISIKLTSKIENNIAIISLIMLSACIVLYFLLSYPIVKKFIFKAMGLFGCVSFSLFALFIDKRMKWLSKKMQIIGVNTLPIYAIHWCLLFSLDIPPLWIFKESIFLLPTVLLGLVLWLMVCFLFIKLFKKNKITRFVLLGEFLGG